MLTPDDAKRLVKNRNDREHRAQLAFDDAELEQLDYLEETVAVYLADSDFVEYVTNLIDEAIPIAIDMHLPLYVGFTKGEHGEYYDDIHEDMRIGEWRMPRETIYGVLFDPTPCEIEASPEDLANMFCETVRALYEDAEWEVGEVEKQDRYFFIFNRYSDGTPDKSQGPGRSGWAASHGVSCFRIYY